MQALAEFDAPLVDVVADDFSTPGITYQIGLPPVRIDILTELTGLTFAEAWPERWYKREASVPRGTLALVGSIDWFS